MLSDVDRVDPGKSGSRYRVSSALKLTFNPWGGFAAALGSTEKNRRELTTREVELLWLFATERSLVEASSLRSVEDWTLEEFEEEIQSLIGAGYLVESEELGCELERFHVFRTTVEAWLASPAGIFPLSSSLPHQRPGIYYPGLTAREFHHPERHEWLESIDWKAFQHEARELAEQRKGYKSLHKGFTSQGAWAGAYLWVHGQEIPEVCDLCPSMGSYLRRTPGATRYGTAFLSVLAAGSHVTPHCGSTNTKLRVQLPIVVPEECYLRVGNYERRLEPETPLVFDDSFLHSAWNHGASARIVLVFDFFHPDLTDLEIEYILSVTPKLDPSTRYTDPLAGESFPDWLDARELVV